MNKEKIRVVRVSPNKLPIMDEINKIGDICYFNIGNSNIEIARDSLDLDFVDFDNNITGVYIKVSHVDKEDTGRYIYSGSGDIEILERNRDVLEHRVYGDIIIIGTYKSLGDEKEEYKSLTIEQVDKFIEMLK